LNSALRENTADAKQLILDREIDAVSVCLPNYLHAQVTADALRAGKHVICENRRGFRVKDAKRIAAAAEKSKKVLMYGFSGDLAEMNWPRSRRSPRDSAVTSIMLELCGLEPGVSRSEPVGLRRGKRAAAAL